MTSSIAPAKLSRRAVLRGAGGVMIALPFLEAMSPPRAANAAGAPYPRRFVVFFESNGFIKEHWLPKSLGAETAFELGRIHQPLQPHKQDLILLSGVDNVASTKGPGSDHMRGFGSMLTGCSLQGGNFAGGGFKSGYADGISLDQKIAGVIGKSTKLKSLELGVMVDSVGHPETRMVFQAPGQPVAPQGDPAAVFGRLFSDFSPEGRARLEKTTRLRRSVLDAVLDDYRSLQPRVGGGDRQKIDAHLQSVREIESRLGAIGAGAGGSGMDACQSPANPGIKGVTCSDQAPCPSTKLREIGRAQMDLMVAALTCDLTRVASLQWGNCGNRFSFPFLGINEHHHDLGHVGESNLSAREKLTKINTWYAEQFAYLLTRMKEVKEGSGTLLDNTLILWCNELSSADKHSHGDMPFVLAGRAGGALKTGRYRAYADVPHNNLLVSCMNAVGAPATTFGNPMFCTGPLAGL